MISKRPDTVPIWGRLLSLGPFLLILFTAPVVSMAAAHSSDPLPSDDFESYPVGSSPSGWLRDPSPGAFVVAQEAARNSLRGITAQPQPAKSLLCKTFPAQGSPLLAQFYVKLPPDADLSFGLSLGSPTAPANRAIQITFQKNRYVTHFDGEAAATIAGFRPDRWVKVALIADPSIAAFHLYLNGTKKTPVPLLFWNVVPQVDTLYFEIPTEAAAACFLDDVLVLPSPAPAAPRGLHIAALGPNEITLRWLPGREPNISAYRLYRAGEFQAQLPPSQTVFTDTGLQPGTGYAYSLTALDGPLRHDESLPAWPVAALTPPLKALTPGTKKEYDVVVYGATPAGIAAALTAARLGSSVALVEPTNHLGGMMSGGLGRTDLRTRSLHGGIFREFIRRVQEFYRSAYGAQSRQAVHSSAGYYFEPGVARAMFEQMLTEQVGIETYFQHRLSSVRTRQFTLRRAQPAPCHSERSEESLQTSLLSITLGALPNGQTKTLHARAFVDASYESDLAALAGAAYRVGREGRDEFNEENAGEIFWDYNTYKVVGGSGKGDNRVQAYNYRLCLTKRPGNKVPIRRPKGYDPKAYATVLLDAQERHLRLSEILSFGRLPNDKFDVNNHGYARQSTDLPEANYDYPDGDARTRSDIELRIKNYILGLLYFLQNDPRLPNPLRSEARQWGLAKDEFTDTANFPPQVYIREARRIIGLYTFSENDARFAQQEGESVLSLDGLDPSLYGEQSRTIGRTPPKPDSIACGDYAMDSHATQKWNPESPDYYEGFFYLPAITKPYQIPYRVLLPQSLQRLLVVFGVSATHVGFGTLRMEPVLMNLGQAAGTAAHLATQRHRWVENVPIDLLQQILVENGQVIRF